MASWWTQPRVIRNFVSTRLRNLQRRMLPRTGNDDEEMSEQADNYLEYIKNLSSFSRYIREIQENYEAFQNFFPQIDPAIKNKMFDSYLKRFFDEDKFLIDETVNIMERFNFFRTSFKNINIFFENAKDLPAFGVAPLNLQNCTYNEKNLSNLNDFFDLYKHCEYQKHRINDSDGEDLNVNLISVSETNDIQQARIVKKILFQYFYINHMFVSKSYKGPGSVGFMRGCVVDKNLFDLDANFSDILKLFSDLNCFLLVIM